MKYVNENTGGVVEIKKGFSWTGLFFGVFHAFYRKQIALGLGLWLASLATCGVALLVYPFFANSMYAKKMMQEGFSPQG